MRFILPLCLLGALVVSGCNLLEAFYDEGNDVDTLLEDARYARAAGDFDRAVSILERALAQDRSHPRVRLQLASTLMQREGLTFLHLERVITHLVGSLDQPATAGRSAASDAAVCTFSSSAATEPFDPRAFEGFDAISGSRATLRYVIELLNDPAVSTETPAMPAELTGIDVCSVVSTSGLAYDRSGVLAALRTQFGSDEAVTSALSTNSVALTLAAYVALFEQPDLPVSWFIVDGSNVGACMAEGHYDLFIQRAQGEVQRVGQAILSLDLLMAHSGNAQYSAYVDDALELYASVEANELNPCNTGR
jgi:hypothetical protein